MAILRPGNTDLKLKPGWTGKSSQKVKLYSHLEVGEAFDVKNLEVVNHAMHFFFNLYIPTQSPQEDWSDHMQNHQADRPLYVRPDVRSADLHLLIKSMVIHDTECPFWDQVSLNKTNVFFNLL